MHVVYFLFTNSGTALLSIPHVCSHDVKRVLTHFFISNLSSYLSKPRSLFLITHLSIIPSSPLHPLHKHVYACVMSLLVVHPPTRLPVYPPSPPCPKHCRPCLFKSTGNATKACVHSFSLSHSHRCHSFSFSPSLPVTVFSNVNSWCWACCFCWQPRLVPEQPNKSVIQCGAACGAAAAKQSTAPAFYDRTKSFTVDRDRVHSIGFI